MRRNHFSFEKPFSLLKEDKNSAMFSDLMKKACDGNWEKGEGWERANFSQRLHRYAIWILPKLNLDQTLIPFIVTPRVNHTIRKNNI